MITAEVSDGIVALVIASIVLVGLFPAAGPLVGLGLLSWGPTAIGKTDDKILRAAAVASVFVGSFLILFAISALLTQFRVR